jgi:murein L,D-transpeptidase YcbB/YkuD
MLWSPLLAAQGEPLEPELSDDSLVFEIRHQLQQRSGPYSPNRNWQQLEEFYAARDYLPVWLDGAGPNARAATFREVLQQVEEEGLEPDAYPLVLLEHLWGSEGSAQQVALELLLTEGFFNYGRELLSGQIDPLWSGQSWHIGVENIDTVALLQALLSSADFATALKSLPPGHPAYQRLREALARYRKIEKEGGWPTIPAGKKLRLGNNDPRVPLLRYRLQLEGAMQFASVKHKSLYDEALHYAVERFQRRHGLQQDGVIGPLTLAELNVPVIRRIAQIRLNMERWRWLPDQLGHRHIVVNLSAYQLSAYDHGERQFTMHTIIGALENQTPQISGDLHTVVFNPHWSIPRNIALEEIIPKQRHNPDYLTSRGIRVFSNWNGGEELDPASIDWARVHRDNFPYMLRQDPGPQNALGKLKFLFTNNFRIYLHDTPAQQLFKQPERTFSHGCIRVEAPRRLAAFLLKGEGDSPWSETAVRSVVATGITHELKITEPVPVYLLYLTAWTGDDGAVHFRRDVYGEDELLLNDMRDHPGNEGNSRNSREQP